jgi:O-antigen/teichoic acid export membrane protein
MNTVWSWAGQLVFIVSGFLLPRSIDYMVGREMLGIWDFAWSIVATFHLLEFGVSSSVNRFVAKHLAEKDPAALNRTVSSVFAIQLIVALVMLAATIAVVVALPAVWGARLGPLITDARWVVFFLGLATAVGFGFGGFAGVLTGCQRWGLYNFIASGSQLIALLCMLLGLFLTDSIKLLGAMYGLGGVVAVVAYAIAAHKVCPVLRIRPWQADRATMARMLTFGGKTFMNGLSRSLLYQASGVMLATYLGPAVLALYNRPLALVQIIRTFTTKFAHTLTPVASAMQATGDKRQLQEFARQMAGVGAALALPPAVFLAILGGPVLLLWMGPDYRDDRLPMILALGHLWAFANLPLQTILTGIDAHGRTAMVSVISSAICAAACWLAVALFGGGVYTIALCLAVTLTLTDGAFVTVYTCRKLKLPLASFLLGVWLRPVFCALPFALWLVLARTLFPPLPAVAVGGGLGAAILATLYWRWVLPDSIRRKFSAKATALGRALRSRLVPGVREAPSEGH